MALTTDMSQRNELTGRKNDYFALKVGNELVEKCLYWVDRYQRHIEQSGKLNTWKRAYKNYYQGGFDNARIRSGGDKNQFLMVQVNHYSNIISHIHNNVTGQRPALKARAMNGDFKSMAQAKVADPVIDYYFTEKNLEDVVNMAAEMSLIFDNAYVMQLWDANVGNDVAVGEDGRVIKDGDVLVKWFTPMDVITDFTMSSPESNLWHITREWVNRWDLAAQYPQYEEAILNSVSSVANMREQRVGHPRYEEESDQIAFYRLIHKKSDILPEGRMVCFVESDNTVIIDTPLPNKTVLHRIAPKEQAGTIWGYTVAYDLLPIQENLNLLYSIIASNQAMFGVQSLLVPKGSGIEYASLQGGLKIVEYDAKPGIDTKPSVLQLTSTPAEIFKHIEHLIMQMEMISGVNSVVRGQPEASLKSGAALALVASQAIQFLSSFHESYINLLESVGTSLIDILKTYAQIPRLISLAGKANTQYMKEFKGSDIEKIDRVTVEVGNPLARTTSGKLQIAQDMIQNNMVENPKQYLQIIETGTIEPLTQSAESQLMLISDENEALSSGDKPVVATMYDQHLMHIQEHACVVSNLDARFDPQVIQRVNAHIQEHINLLGSLNPIIAGATGQPVMAQPMTGNAPQVTNPTPPVQQKAAGINLPKAPQAPQFAATGGR